jgi:glycosyltransferase involved in cell wall biosynthesis
LWSGGLWDWLDPLTLIHALSELATQYPDLKLYFMGTRHPNPIVQGMKMPDQAISLSQELGVYNKSVFFGDWVAYEDRVNYLLEADMAVITHPAHIETRFSNRTRVLDCIWTGLPIITTEGDAMADWVRDENLGITVPACDVQALSNAIIQLLTMGGRNEFKQSFASLRAQLSWDKVISPLANFCSSPSIATDKGKYLTELERYRRDAEKYLQQVIVDKDAFLEKVINDKDAYIEQVIADKDAVIEKYQKMLPVKIYQGIRKTISKS